MSEIRLAIAGIGNCASAFIQGLYYYEKNKDTVGLIYPEMGGYKTTDIKVVAAFEVDRRKVGKDLSEAIFAEPNCTIKFYDVPFMNVKVMMGPLLDGVPEHLAKFIKVSNDPAADIAKILRETGADVLINILPTGSSKATRAYADACIKHAKVAFVNGIPEMIASSQEYAKIALENKVPLIGDDFKSQIGTTLLHRNLISTLLDRGMRIDKMYQYNFAGNTDFANLENRGQTKEVTKKTALKAELPYIDEIPWGFAPMYIEGQDDIKTGIIHIQGRNWGGNVINVDVKVEVDDSANAAGVMVDMIRGAKIAKDRGMGGIIEPVCAYYAKHPPIQIHDKEAKRMLDEFIV
ncbi:MAG: inositol-3-phosphate synthase [Actinobacteria bacterium]|nr:inositol-3-phosphate synthase [Actinomycetota bacterium]